MVCLETFPYLVQNLSYLNDVASLSQRLHEAMYPRAGSPRLKPSKSHGGSWAEPYKAQKCTHIFLPALLPRLHWPSATKQPKCHPSSWQDGVVRGDGSQGTVADPVTVTVPLE